MLTLPFLTRPRSVPGRWEVSEDLIAFRFKDPVFIKGYRDAREFIRGLWPVENCSPTIKISQ